MTDQTPEARRWHELSEIGAHVYEGCDTPDECASEIAPTLAADLALAAAVRGLPRTVWLGRTPEGWCVLTDNGTDEGKPHIAPDPLAAIKEALRDE